MFSHAMAHHSRHEENDDHSWQQPNRADDDIAWQREINCADCENCGNRLSARLRFVDLLWQAHLHSFYPISRAEARELLSNTASSRTGELQHIVPVCQSAFAISTWVRTRRAQNRSSSSCRKTARSCLSMAISCQKVGIITAGTITGGQQRNLSKHWA